MLHVSLLVSNIIPTRSLASLSTFVPGTEQTLQCDVIFGSPSADCRGTGICKITGTNAFSPITAGTACQITQAFAQPRKDQGGITLFFFRSFLCTQLYRRHFWKGILKMDEPCPLPEDIRTQLGLAFNTLLPGKYVVKEENGCFQVDIDCA
ncbi:MAG: hypothetical protein JNJ57_06775 [Saprospiraceae bacterium]|nr:hypothetical protein [Saprospiraceae bacterium]